MSKNTNLKSFTYVISSNERTNSIGTNTNTYDINFGGFSDSHDNFYFEVINTAIQGNTLGTNVFLLLVAEGLADNGSFCNSKLGREAIMSTIPLAANTMMLNNGSSGNVFRANNCRMKKKIRFRFLKPDLTVAVDGTDINVGAETKWFLTFKVTPIDD